MISGGTSLGTLVVYLAANATQFQRQMNSVTGSFKDQMEGMIRTAKYASVAIGGSMVAIAALAAKEFMKFESSFAGVRKTVNATEAEFDRFEESFRKMALQIPVNVNEINSIAEAAGQLGIKNKNIEGFTRVMADLGVSTNLASKEAAQSLAQFANITKMSQEDFGRLGSTIVGLGNRMATTESQIVSMAMRLAGAGENIGLSEAQIMGLAAALSSLGVEAEAGGTAMSMSMIEMAKAVAVGGEQLKLFAAVTGQSTEQLKKDFAQDAAGSVIRFIEGLGNLQKQGTSVHVVLNQLGMDGARMTDVLSRLSGSGDILRNALSLANKEWSANNALTDEAEKRYATLDSQLILLKNFLQDVFITIGQALAPTLRALNGIIQDSIKETGGWKDEIKFFGDLLNTGFITAITAVTYAIRGWQMVTTFVQVAMIQSFKKIVDGLQALLKGFVDGLDLARRAANGYMKWMSLGLSKDIDPFKLEGLNDTIKTLGNYSDGAAQEVANLATSFDKLIAKGDPMEKFWEKYKNPNPAPDQFDLPNMDRKMGPVFKVADVPTVSVEMLEFLKRMQSPMTAGLDGMAKFHKLLRSGSIDIIQYSTALRDAIASSNEFIAPTAGLHEMTGNSGLDQTLSLVNEETLMRDSYSRRIDELNAYYDSVQGTQFEREEERYALLEEMESRYNARMMAFQNERKNLIIGNLGETTSQLMSIAESFGNEQSGFYKASFIATKAFASAQAIMNAELAATNALALYPPPTNQIMYGVTKALGYASAGAIMGQALASFEGGGMMASGPRMGGIDGRGGKLAVLHPNEKVLDLNNSDSESGLTVKVFQTFTGGVTKQDLQNSEERTKRAAMDGVVEAISRGGAYRKQVQR